MRTLSSLSLIVMAAAVTILSASPASAQRHARQHRLAHAAQRAQAANSAQALDAGTPEASLTPCADEDCADDYTLSVVTALFPYDNGATAGPQFVTLVIENRGTARAPSSIVAVAPRNHATLVNRVSFASLAPGARTTVQVPVEIGADGTPCITISITPGILPSVNQAMRYALADPDPEQSDWGD